MCRIVLKVFLYLVLPTASFANKGPDFSIFEVRRQLALSNDEKTEKDYYIYAGSEEGVKEGTVYDVVRNVPLYDGFQNRSMGEITVKVAQLRVIFVDKNVSVARFHQDFTREGIPVLQENYILLGDLVDVKSASKVAQEEGSEKSTQTSSVQLVINSIDMTDRAYNP